METNSILTNEYSNNGYQIHLYRGEMTGMWYAYGYSAYGLRLFGKSNGYNSIRGYSKSLQMPCTITSNESVIPLLQNAIEVASQTDTYISLRMPDAINTDAYTKWVNKLKDGHADQIHRCVRCNKKCLGGLMQHQGTHCIYEK